jgi:predicted DNA-binding ribbon-helix-helix protein
VDEFDDEAAGEIPRKGARKRSLSVRGRATSIAISDSLWFELREMARADGLSANQLVTRIRSSSEGNLGRAIRLYIINRRLQKES